MRAGAKGLLVASRVIGVIVAVVVLVGTGVVWKLYNDLSDGLTQSKALRGRQGSTGGDRNILIMGLDSRLDVNGNPLPQEMYDALHAGDETSGGYNANVLILLHIPAGGEKATAISIPRDDYVDFPGCPGGQCKGKIKQAYGLAHYETKTRLQAEGGLSDEELERQAREAGRIAEIDTVQQFLGGVPIDHFVEVTLIAFFQVAEVVQPIRVCLTQATSDVYSGARFRKGEQDISASQAMAFVRQRRDPNTDLNFTDLDRNRRQQAFIVSLAQQLQRTGAITDLGRLQRILDVAKPNIAVDEGLDLMDLASSATDLAGNTTFYTLPVQEFTQNEFGEDINQVDVPLIRAIVADILGTSAIPSSTPPRPTGSRSAAPTTSTTPTTSTPTAATTSDAPVTSIPSAVTAAPTSGARAPDPTELSVLGSSGVPCVK